MGVNEGMVKEDCRIISFDIIISFNFKLIFILVFYFNLVVVVVFFKICYYKLLFLLGFFR